MRTGSKSRENIRVLLFLLPIFFLGAPASHAALGRKAMVATADPRATDAAFAVLQSGGNAVDAAVAAQWVLNVVEPQSSGLGGGGFFLYYEARTKRIYAFDGREASPAAAFPDMFLDEKSEPYPFFPDRVTGGLPVGVPGVLKMLHEVHSRFGSKQFSFSELFDPAIRLAESGFPVSERLSRFIDEQKDRLKLFEDSRRLFLAPDGSALAPGTRLVQSELAGTFRLLQRNGIPAFYEGQIAEAITQAVRHAPFHPGLMTKEDLFYYKVKERNPVTSRYRGYDVFSMPPPSSGGTTLLEALHILENYHLRVHGRSADGLHLLNEAQKLAFQDRDRYVGDPDRVRVPVEKLISKKYAVERLENINFDRAIPVKNPAAVILSSKGAENTQTSHLSIVDPKGNMVAFTTTIEHVFGSAMIVPGFGFFLNNELTDFDVPAKDTSGKMLPNAPGPEKRPRSSMTPVFIFQAGKPLLIAGSPGGSKIIGTVLNVIVNLLDFKMPLDQALKAKRLINRAGPAEFEEGFGRFGALKRNFEKRGHEVIVLEPSGNVQAVYFDQESGLILGASDPRGEGRARGF